MGLGSLVPGPAAQLPLLTVQKATESWAGPGDKARLGLNHVQHNPWVVLYMYTLQKPIAWLFYN